MADDKRDRAPEQPSPAEALVRARGEPERRDVAREYALSTLKGAIGAIPYAGGLLNEVLFEARSRLKAQRLEEFFTAVAGDVSRLKDSMVDMEYMRSEEFSDLVEEICLRVARTASVARRDHLRKVLVGAMRGQRQTDHTPVFLDVLGEIGEPELMVLEKISSPLRPGARSRATIQRFVYVLHMCPSAAPSAGTGRDHVEREGMGIANGSAPMKGNGAFCLE